MPRKNINMSEAQLLKLRDSKLNFQSRMKINQLSDIEYILRVARIVDKTLEHKQG